MTRRALSECLTLACVLALIAGMMFLPGCDGIATVTPQLVADCERICETRNGWESIKWSAGCYCRDGMHYVIDEPQP